VARLPAILLLLARRTEITRWHREVYPTLNNVVKRRENTEARYITYRIFLIHDVYLCMCDIVERHSTSMFRNIFILHIGFSYSCKNCTYKFLTKEHHISDNLIKKEDLTNRCRPRHFLNLRLDPVND
jgi:hypothetical protein